MRDDNDNQSGDEAARGGSGRYGKSDDARGRSHQDSKKLERKETERGFVPRQGGDPSEHGQTGGAPRHD